MRGVLFIVLLIALAAPSGPASAQDSPPEIADPQTKAAVEAAEDWLYLLDRGRYNQAWDEAARYYQTAISGSAWEAAMIRKRRPLGELKKRTFFKAAITNEIPRAPKGRYVIAAFKSDFRAESDVLEIVAVKRQADGAWRVASYEVR